MGHTVDMIAHRAPLHVGTMLVRPIDLCFMCWCLGFSLGGFGLGEDAAQRALQMEAVIVGHANLLSLWIIGDLYVHLKLPMFWNLH